MSTREEFSTKTRRAAYARAGGICSVDKCERLASRRGMCSVHYFRFRKYGEPTAGGKFRKQYGSRIAFLRAAIEYDGDECLLWPFSDNGNGYPILSINGKNRYAHRMVCEAVHGPAEGGQHAAHKCGNGNLGCITPKHIRWATVKENSEDTKSMGRTQKGEKQHNSKLKETDVLIIRSMRGKIHERDLADEYRVDKQTIRDVWFGRSWAWLPDTGSSP